MFSRQVKSALHFEYTPNRLVQTPGNGVLKIHRIHRSWSAKRLPRLQVDHWQSLNGYTLDTIFQEHHLLPTWKFQGTLHWRVSNIVGQLEMCSSQCFKLKLFSINLIDKLNFTRIIPVERIVLVKCLNGSLRDPNERMQFVYELQICKFEC